MKKAIPVLLLAAANLVQSTPQSSAKAASKKVLSQKASTSTSTHPLGAGREATLSLKTASTGARTDLKKLLWPERPTIFAFYKPSSTMEREFVQSLELSAENKMGFFVIPLKSGNEPVALQHGIHETPTVLVYDRRGRLVGRSSNASKVYVQVERALQVMRIAWAQDGDPRLDATRQLMGGQKQVPDILRTMSLRPDYMQGFMVMAYRAQFTDGFIDRRTKELIGTYASALNKCPYCQGSHAAGLQLQGQAPADVDAVATLRTKDANFSAKEQALLDYVKLLTLEPSKVRDSHTQKLRQVGWSDEQIFEASYITSLFAFTNRMANAYGLEYPSGGWLPPALRKSNLKSQSPSPATPIAPATNAHPNAQPATATGESAAMQSAVAPSSQR